MTQRSNEVTSILVGFSASALLRPSFSAMCLLYPELHGVGSRSLRPRSSPQYPHQKGYGCPFDCIVQRTCFRESDALRVSICCSINLSLQPKLDLITYQANSVCRRHLYRPSGSLTFPTGSLLQATRTKTHPPGRRSAAAGSAACSPASAEAIAAAETGRRSGGFSNQASSHC